MGLIFNRTKTNFRYEMSEYVKCFMLQYINDFPLASDVVIPIFSNANEMIKGLSEKDLRKAMRSNGVNIECAALNTMQNFAMVELKPKPCVDFLTKEDDALSLYRYINNLKYMKGYISKRQFDENEMLATKLSVQSPLGNWF